jgi:hypothetical protein
VWNALEEVLGKGNGRGGFEKWRRMRGDCRSWEGFVRLEACKHLVMPVI